MAATALTATTLAACLRTTALGAAALASAGFATAALAAATTAAPTAARAALLAVGLVLVAAGTSAPGTGSPACPGARPGSLGGRPFGDLRRLEDQHWRLEGRHRHWGGASRLIAARDLGRRLGRLRVRDYGHGGYRARRRSPWLPRRLARGCLVRGSARLEGGLASGLGHAPAAPAEQATPLASLLATFLASTLTSAR